MKYFNATSTYCNTTLNLNATNPTTYYGDTHQSQGFISVTSAGMLILATLFFSLNLFSRFSDVSAFLNPSIRPFLKVSLSVFLPVMSYLFSEAKGSVVATTGRMQAQATTDELSLRARTILLWMLLVELLHKKVEAILCAGGGAEAYSGTIERAARVMWLGYLVFVNLRSLWKRAIYGGLWLLAAAKLVQRFVASELGRRSFAYNRNPQLLASYMAHILREEQSQPVPSPSLKLKQCRYAVMGEEYLKKSRIMEGYEFDNDAAAFVTVGSIWELAEKEGSQNLLQRDPLKRLCLSFALYKLLRRRLEDFPITANEAQNCHDLIFNGLCEQGGGEEEKKENQKKRASTLFQVLNNEVQFLCEYYHSIQPVIFASPFFFLINHIMFPIIVWALFILMITLCNNGDVHGIFQSIKDVGEYPMTTIDMVKVVGCVVTKITVSQTYLIYTIDTFVTILLVVTFVYNEFWEFIVFLLSNWFMVSLICCYTSKPQWRRGRFFTGVIRLILWVRTKLSKPNVCFKQFSVLWLGQLSSSLPTKAVPIEAKVFIMQHLAKPPNISSCNTDSSLTWHLDSISSRLGSTVQLSWACKGDCIAHIILTWHLATTLLEATHPVQRREKPGPNRKAATMLSKYCAYLVAFHPELLPGDKDATERVYKDMKTQMKQEIGCWAYYFCRRDKLMEVIETTAAERQPVAPLKKGMRLGKILRDKCDEDVWKLLAELWTVIMVYAATAVGEVHVKAHKEGLAHGGEFITMLWALSTHTGASVVHDPTATMMPHHQIV